eukprot:6184600-Pleurochrysis_carterae.AAC.5
MTSSTRANRDVAREGGERRVARTSGCRAAVSHRNNSLSAISTLDTTLAAVPQRCGRHEALLRSFPAELMHRAPTESAPD